MKNVVMLITCIEDVVKIYKIYIANFIQTKAMPIFTPGFVGERRMSEDPLASLGGEGNGPSR